MSQSKRIGFVHPGQMGARMAAAVISAGNEARWASEGRSAQTAQRAADEGLVDSITLDALATDCDIIFSICPPDQATEVAAKVAATGFDGIYVDGNAVSPASGERVADTVTGAGARFVDGGIIGPPPVRSGMTRFYLSGEDAAAVATLFDGSIVDARPMGPGRTDASALKMAFAGWSKGSSALMMNQFALAKAANVDDWLLKEWAITYPDLEQSVNAAAVRNAGKAWRFVGEMREIERTLNDAGLPGDWFSGAAQIYARMAGFKDCSGVGHDEVLAALLVARSESNDDPS